MNRTLRFFLLAAIFIYFFSVIFLLKKQKLQLKYSLMWGIAGIVMLMMVIFPDFIIGLIHLIGIIDTNVGILAIALFILMLISISLTSIVSKLNMQNKRLIQTVALMEYRIRVLEEKFNLKRKDNENV